VARRPPQRSQPPRGGLTLSRPWGGCGSLCRPPGRAALARSPELDFTFTPRASRPRGSALTGPAHPSGAFAFLPASTPPTPRSGRCGGALPGARLPEARPEPSPSPSSRTRLAGGLGAHSPSLPTLIGRARRFGAPAPRRRSAGAFRRPAPSPNPPSSGGPASFSWESGAGWMGGSGKKIFVCWAGQAPSWTLSPLALFSGAPRC